YLYSLSFFFYHSPTTQIPTLSLHDALPILNGRGTMTTITNGATSTGGRRGSRRSPSHVIRNGASRCSSQSSASTSSSNMLSKIRSEEHTSELQSLAYLVCRLLLEKKKKKQA